MTDTTTTAPATATPAATPGILAVLLAGPALTALAAVAATNAGALSAISQPVWVWTLLLFWSPLPFGVPALLMERQRDAALPTLARPLRAVALLPWMLLSAQSPARALTAASLVGFVTGLAAAAALV